MNKEKERKDYKWSIPKAGVDHAYKIYQEAHDKGIPLEGKYVGMQHFSGVTVKVKNEGGQEYVFDHLALHHRSGDAYGYIRDEGGDGVVHNYIYLDFFSETKIVFASDLDNTMFEIIGILTLSGDERKFKKDKLWISKEY